MSEIVDQLFEYGLHDTKIENIEVKENQLVLTFPNGVYALNAFGKETVLTGQCHLTITVDQAFCANIYDLIDIAFAAKSRRVLLDAEEIASLAGKEKLSVHNVWYSRFNSAVLFDCGNSKGNYYITIEQCAKIAYVFADRSMSALKDE